MANFENFKEFASQPTVYDQLALGVWMQKFHTEKVIMLDLQSH